MDRPTDGAESAAGISDFRIQKNAVLQLTESRRKELVHEFANDWNQGGRPEVIRFLNRAAQSGNADRAALAADLIRVDLECRLRAGESPLIDDYLADIPELREARHELVALLIDEHAMRTGAGRIVSLEEYARRFPEHLETLRHELELTDDRVGSPTTYGDDEIRSPGEATDLIRKLECGDVIGDFRIQRRLGSGGVSEVFLATQLSLDRDVALKVTVENGEADSPVMEGRTMAALSHPNIVSVFAEEQAGSRRLLAMEYVDGPTLAEFLKRSLVSCGSGSRKLTTSEVISLIQYADSDESVSAEQNAHRSCRGPFRDFLCGVARDVARALDAAASQEILHCDVKPANILLTRDGQALLTDFNVSIRRKTMMADPVPLGGTLLYMSPEQLGVLTGSQPESQIDARSDVYSLGLVLFESLTGSWPFPEDAVVSDPIVAAGQLQASRLSCSIEFPAGSRWLTPGLRSIIRKCLEPNPDERYRSARELADDLDRFLSHRPLKTATDPSWTERTVKWIRRSPVRAVAAALIVLTGLTLASGGRKMISPRNSSDIAVADSTGPVSAVTGLEASRQAQEAERAGQELIRAGRFHAAAIEFERATRLNPQLVAAWHNLGIARFRQGQFADALGAFDRSIALGNESGLAHSHRAAARFALGDRKGAEADFAHAQQIALPHERDEIEENQREFERLKQATILPVE